MYNIKTLFNIIYPMLLASKYPQSFHLMNHPDYFAISSLNWPIEQLDKNRV